MNRRQQCILRRYGDWQVADILVSPDAGISAAKASQFSASCYLVDGTEYRMQTTSRGIELSAEYGQAPVDVLTWKTVAKYAITLPRDCVDRLHSARAALSESQRAYPVFAASRAAQGCGRPPATGPVTEAQALYEVERRDWHDNRLVPWQQQRREVDAELATAVDQALPLAGDNPEPQDLLDLLATCGAS